MFSIKDFHLETLSNQYYQFIDDFAKTDYESTKLLGQFYTSYDVTDEMVARILAHFTLTPEHQNIRIIDPFCGDGRLVLKLLQAINQDNELKRVRLYISLWDIDITAVNKAQYEIEKFIKENDIDAKINAEKTDAYVAYFDVAGNYDICVTNPPWGLLKPLKLFNSRCTEEELEVYKSSIAAYDNYMKKEFLVSQPTSKFGKWGTNLGRCGLEVALKLISPFGICGFVSPASLFNDQVSVPFRKWIFDMFSLRSISYFPAELKLYGSADVSSITAIATKGTTTNIKVRLYDLEFHCSEKEFDKRDIELIRKNDFHIPLEFGIEAINLQVQLESFITLEEYCKKNDLHFVRELDETRLKEKVNQNGKIIFAKGYMVDRYAFCSDGLFLNEKVVEAPKTVEFNKLVWRDVSRNSQKRRLKATILPTNCIVGNSLGAIYSGSNNIELLKTLLSVINSYVFEFQARRKLVSNHVPAGVLKKVKIPNIISDEKLNMLIENQMQGKGNEALIEVYVAKTYGMEFEKFMRIVKTFSIDEDELRCLENAWNKQI